jgi:hypothetical protein
MLKAVSNIGSPRQTAGRASDTIVPVFMAHITLTEPSMKPRNILPQSPIKIRAGLKLKNKNPDKLPVKASIITASTRSPQTNANTAITVQAIAQIPAASPSRPSIRFTALVMLIIHRIVNGKENSPNRSVNRFAKFNDSIRAPAKHINPAAAICARSLYLTLTPRTSSTKPTRKMKVAAPSRAMICVCIPWNLSPIALSKNSTVITSIVDDRKMAIPPIRGIWPVCTFLAVGLSYILSLRPTAITIGVIIIDRIQEHRYVKIKVFIH